MSSTNDTTDNNGGADILVRQLADDDGVSDDNNGESSATDDIGRRSSTHPAAAANPTASAQSAAASAPNNTNTTNTNTTSKQQSSRSSSRQSKAPQRYVARPSKQGWDCSQGDEAFLKDDRRFTMGAGFAPNSSSSSSCVDDGVDDESNNEVDVEHDGNVGEDKIDGTVVMGDGDAIHQSQQRSSGGDNRTIISESSAWKCTRCDHINTYTKSRCKQCQGWKGGRREGLLKSSPSSTASAKKAGSAASGGSTTNASSGKKKKIKKQTGNSKGGGKAATVNTTPAANAGSSIEPWKCTRCSHINTYTKARCASCQGWKGGYREGYSPSSNKKSSSSQSSSLPSPSPSKRRSRSTPTKRTAVATSSKGSSAPKATKKVVGVVVDRGTKKSAVEKKGEETIEAWKCTKCNHTNTYTKSRCKKCQGWKGGKREGYVSPTGRSNKKRKQAETTNKVLEEEEMEEINTANATERRRRNRAQLSSSPAAGAAAGQESMVDKEHAPTTKRTRSSRTCASKAAAAADSAGTTTSTTMNHSMTAYTQRKSNLSRRPRQFKPTEKIMAMHEDQQLQSKSTATTTAGNTNNKKQQQGRAGIKNTTKGCGKGSGGKGRMNRGGIGQLKHPPELIGSSTASTAAATTATAVEKHIPHKEKKEESEDDDYDDDESNYDDVACCLCKCAVDFSDLHFFLPPPREEANDNGEEMKKSENDNTCANVGSGEKSEGSEHENDKKMTPDELLNNESRKLPARNSFESTAMNDATSTSGDSTIGKTNTATTAPSTNTAATPTSILSDELHNEHFEEEKKDDYSSNDNQEGGLKSSSSDNVEFTRPKDTEEQNEKAVSKQLSANKNDGYSESSDEELSSSSDDGESEEEERAPFRLPHHFYNPGNALILCDGPVYAGKKRQGNSSDDSPEYECNRAYHQQCHFIPVLSIPRGPWRCLICRYRDELYLREKKMKKTTKVGKNKKGRNVDSLIGEGAMSDGELTDIFRCVSIHVPPPASSPPLSIPVENVVTMQNGNSAGLAGTAPLPDEPAVNKTAEKAVVGSFESTTAGEVERNRNVDASANNKTKATALQTNDESVTAKSTSVDATMKANGEGKLKLSKGVKPVGTDAVTSTNTNSSNDKELKASNSNANSLSDLPDNLAEDENSNTAKSYDFEQVATLEHTFEHLSASLKARLLHQELTTKSKSLISSSLASIRTAEHSMRSFTESARSRKALAERIESSYKNHYAKKKRGGKKRKRSSLDVMGLPQELCQCVQRIAVCKTKVRELIAGLENVIKHKPPQPGAKHSLPGAMNLSKHASENCSRKTGCDGDVISELMQWYASQQSQQSMCVDISTEEQVSQANGDEARQSGEKSLLHHLFPEGNLSRRRYEPRTPEAHIDATTLVEAPSLAEEPASASVTGKSCDDDNHSHSSGVSLSSLTCASCLLSHASDANDMLLCDGMGCYRAIHMKCLEPKVTLDDLETSDEDDWFCPLCVAHATLIHYAQREYLGDDWYDEVTAKNNKGDTNDEEEETINEWESAADVFPEASFELRVANKFNQGIMDGETASYLSETFGIKTSASVSGSGDMAGHERTGLLADEEDDEDDDFDHDEENGEGDDSLAEDSDEERRLASDTICKDELDALSVTSADGSDEGDKSTGTSDNEDGTSSGVECRPRKSKRKRFTLPERSDATSDGDEDDHSGRSSVQQPGGDGVVDVANIVRGKRSRTKVDYRKLADAMFGDESDDDAKGAKKEFIPKARSRSSNGNNVNSESDNNNECGSHNDGEPKKKKARVSNNGRTQGGQKRDEASGKKKKSSAKKKDRA